MLINLIEFGGIIFWAIVAFLGIFAFLSCESDEMDVACPVLFFISLLVVYGLSNTPTIDLRFVAGYFGAGIAWSLILFHFKLLKVRNWLKAHPEAISDGKACPSKMDRSIRYIYDSEPSFSKFSSRITCWPFSILKFVFGDMLRTIYDCVKHFLVNYKNNLLGLKP